MPQAPRFIATTYGQKLKEIIQGPKTRRLLIYGTAVDGPKNTPTPVRSLSEFERLFGPASYSGGYLDPVTSTQTGAANGASLPLYVAQALSAGCTDIYVVRYTGTTASATGFGTKLDVRAVYPGRIYNTVALTLTSQSSAITIAVTQPSIKGGSFSTSFASSLSISNVIDALNTDTRNKSFYIERNTFSSYLTAACTTLSTGSVTLSGGTNGTTAPGEDYETSKLGMATSLYTPDTGAFAVIENLPFKFDVATLDIYADDQITNSGNTTSDSIATSFVMHLDTVYSNIGPCEGVIAVRPHNYREWSDIINYINNNLLATSHGFWDSNQRWLKAGPILYNGWTRTDPVAGTLDLGSRLSVVAGPSAVYTHQDIGKYMDQWHVSYAALLTTLPPEYAAFNRTLPGVVSYGTAYPDKYCRLLATGVGHSESDTSGIDGMGGYVTVTRDPDNFNGSMIISDDPTAAARNDYGRGNQIMRLAAAVHGTLYLELKQFLNHPTDAATMAAIETKVENVLEGYTKSGGLRGSRGQGYDFTVFMDGNDNALGIIRVVIELKPATALRHIFVSVGVTR